MALQLPKSNDKAIDLVEKRLRIATDKQRADFKRFDRYYKLFRNYIPEGRWPWRSKIFVPYVYSTIITLVSKMVANDPIIEFGSRQPGKEKSAELNSKLFSYQWERIQGFLKLVDWVVVSLIVGKGIVKLYWRYEKKHKKVKQFSLFGLRSKVVEKDVVTFDGPDFDVLDPLDLFVDPSAKTIYEASWVIHRTYPTLEELKSTVDSNGDLIYTLPSDDEIAKEGAVDPLNADVVGTYKRRRARVVGPVTSMSDDTVDRTELLEHWTDDEVTTVLNRKWIIRREENPYWHGEKPFVEMVDTPNPFDFMKIGTVEPIERLQHGLNDLVNQRIDNVSLILNRMWKVLKGADVDEHELISRPNGIIHTADMAGIEPVETQDVTGSSYNEEQNIKYDIQQATGISDLYAKGVGGDTVVNRTATGANLIVEETNTRVKFKMKFMDAALTKLGQIWHEMNQQFIDDDIVLRITGVSGTEFLTMSPADIVGDYDVIPVSGSTEPVNKQAQASQYMQWFQNIIQTFPIWGEKVSVNWYEIVTTLSDKLGIENLDSIFPRSEGATQPSPPEEKNENQSKVTVTVPGNSPVGIEILENMGQLTPEQAQELHPVVTGPTVLDSLQKQQNEQDRLQLEKQKHAAQTVIEAARVRNQAAQHQNQQKMSLMQSVLGRFSGNQNQPGQDTDGEGVGI